jgi:hypothetical protein
MREITEEYLQELKSYQINRARSITSKKLTVTDWYFTRRTEREVEIPADIAAERATTIEKFDTFEAAILSGTTKNIYETIKDATIAFDAK